MTQQEWQKVKRVLAEALERDPAERKVFLDAACPQEELRREVESLIASHEQSGSSLLDGTVADEGGLSAGTRLGPYEIIKVIGRGGMGEVFEARDTKLGRSVAIKALPQEFANDAERLARFGREAKMLASLNHPNIATIYGFEGVNGTEYLVMELVGGETLAERVSKGPVKMREALKIGVQIAAALEAAHEKGVIHRDLKPANVKVTPEGRVKVLDFGLAKGFITTDEARLDPTKSERARTEEGLIVGTPAYMSPEQARGKPVDKRTDIWAFGCVMYELLTGQRAFGGETVSDTVAAVLEKDPDYEKLPAATPLKIRELLRRCLQRDALQRLRDVGDARIAIEEVLAEGSETRAGGASLAQSERARKWKSWTAAGVAAVLLILIALWRFLPFDAGTSEQVSRVAIQLPAGQLLAGLETGLAVALSPDGTQLAYVARQGGKQQLYMRPLNGLEAKAVSGSEGAVEPFFSPDGKWLGFFATGKLKKVSLSGGEIMDLADAPDPRGGSWGDRGSILFSPTRATTFLTVSEAGGNTQTVTEIEGLGQKVHQGENAHRWPEFLPGSETMLFAAGRSGANWSNAQVVAVDVKTGARKNLLSGTNPRYASSGYLIFAREGNLMAAAFDAKKMETRGAAVPVVEGVLQSSLTGAAEYGISSNGALIYVPADVQANQRRMVWVDRKGAEQFVQAPLKGYRQPRISPDGRQIAVAIQEKDTQVWLYDLRRETLTRFSFGDKNVNYNPIWTPDGKRILFQANDRLGETELLSQMADGSRKSETINTRGHGSLGNPSSFSPDGQILALTLTGNPTFGYDIALLKMGSSEPLQFYLETPYNEGAAVFSPNGHWVAYSSDETGRYEIYMHEFPGPGGKFQISTAGGTEPVWNRNGRELFYRSGDKMMAVDIVTHPAFSAGKPRMLFQGQYQPDPTVNANYDVSPDGQRFLMLKPGAVQEMAPTQINVVLNWFEELKQKVAK